MESTHISVDLVETRLSELGQDRKWLESQMGWEKNLITNWKKRGIPASYAARLALVLGVTTDWLLEMPKAAKQATIRLATFNSIPPDEIGELVLVYCQSDPTWRKAIMAAVAGAKAATSAGSAADDQLEGGL